MLEQIVLRPSSPATEQHPEPRGTVYKLIHDEELPVIRLGRRVLIPAVALRACWRTENSRIEAYQRCYPILAARDRLSVDDAGPGAQLGDCLDDERESVGQVITRSAIELHPFALLARNDMEPVVLDFLQ